jgi:hypothetical protein
MQHQEELQRQQRSQKFLQLQSWQRWHDLSKQQKQQQGPQLSNEQAPALDPQQERSQLGEVEQQQHEPGPLRAPRLPLDISHALSVPSSLSSPFEVGNLGSSQNYFSNLFNPSKPTSPPIPLLLCDEASMLGNSEDDLFLEQKDDDFFAL